ncbi:MAG: hypothetical protein ACI362_04190, partial [Coriobacteriales bacterium]
VIHAQHAWWYPEQDPNEPNLFSNWKSSINVGLPNFYHGVQGWGNLNKCCIARIEKTENDVTDILTEQDVLRVAAAKGMA